MLIGKFAQLNLSTMTILGTEDSGLCREVAIVGRQGCNMTLCFVFFKKSGYC